MPFPLFCENLGLIRNSSAELFMVQIMSSTNREKILHYKCYNHQIEDLSKQSKSALIYFNFTKSHHFPV